MVNLSYLASVHGRELDDMLAQRDFVCPECSLESDYHVQSCGVLALLEARRRMVPTVMAAQLAQREKVGK